MRKIASIFFLGIFASCAHIDEPLLRDLKTEMYQCMSMGKCDKNTKMDATPTTFAQVKRALSEKTLSTESIVYAVDTLRAFEKGSDIMLVSVEKNIQENNRYIELGWVWWSIILAGGIVVSSTWSEGATLKDTALVGAIGGVICGVIGSGPLAITYRKKQRLNAQKEELERRRSYITDCRNEFEELSGSNKKAFSSIT